MYDWKVAVLSGIENMVHILSFEGTENLIIMRNGFYFGTERRCMRFLGG